MVFGIKLPDIAKFSFDDFFQSGKGMVSEVQRASIARHNLNIDVDLYDADSNSMLDTSGVITDDFRLLKVPYYSRVHLFPLPYWRKGRLTIQLSKKYHGCLSLKKMDKLANSIKYSADLELKNVSGGPLKVSDDNVTQLVLEDKLVVAKIENVVSQHDFTLWDNEFSSSFAHACHCIIQGHFMEVIMQLPNRQQILSFALCGVIGIVFGITFDHLWLR